ncbi:helix-turn-helix domain-containing protein [Heliorestis acidaminivorans]|uniref:Helix-turn-helix domain-containing protein n=2 Tax=Heliorestis acidaminivorans TaxID=553427 RepID=A0A6I0EV67_9FIRM|nr:helix-turn-helix domain-containing protein [Heliorestis acidaminivorans]
MTNEVGIDFDNFIDGIAKDRSDTEMAEEFGVTPKTIGHLKNHFWRYGINDIQGQD